MVNTARSLVVLVCLAGLWPAHAADELELKDGDRVVFLGNTLIEREPRHGYWETALTLGYPDRNITFRNLGWSGDTVWGEARARFGGPADGFKHLKEHVLALKPTVIILGYGLNESFAGEAGLPRFQKGLDTLLDTLAATQARIIILSPMKQEKLPPPLPDPVEQNRNIQLYRDSLAKTAEKRRHAFIDLDKGSLPRPFTDNGIHMTPYGYWATALELGQAFGIVPQPLDLDAKAAKDLTWKIESKRLPLPMPKDMGSVGASLLLRIKGLSPGSYALKIDGQPAGIATAQEWAKGLSRLSGPEIEQAEKLRALIIEKNQTYFHRWRPQNETYLFLFRKGEQGQNAKEIPEFDPLVEKLEQEIAKLRKPVEREYKLVKE